MLKKTIFSAFLFCTLAYSLTAQWVVKPSGTTQSLMDIHAVDFQTAYIVGQAGTVLKSTNQGNSWELLSSPTTNRLEAVYFLSETTGFIGGEDGLFKTTNGGQSWTTVNIPTTATILELFFLNDQKGFCVGEAGLIMLTEDGGTTWVKKETGLFRYFCSIQFPTPQIGYISARGYNWSILKTTDGGNTWNEIPIQPIQNTSNLEGICFTDENTGYLGGWYISAFISTNDGGQSWAEMPNDDQKQVYSIDFPDAQHGYTVGWSGLISHTNDGGNTWQNQSTPDNSYIYYEVSMLDVNTGFIVGDGGIILKTENGGVSSSVSPISIASQLVIAPNPAHDTIEIFESPKPIFEFTLTNSSGQIVLSTNLQGQTRAQFNTSALSPGTYFYTAQDSDLFIHKGKIVIR